MRGDDMAAVHTVVVDRVGGPKKYRDKSFAIWPSRRMQSLHDYAFGEEEKARAPSALHGRGAHFMLVALVESIAILATAMLAIACIIGGLIALHVFQPKKKCEFRGAVSARN